MEDGQTGKQTDRHTECLLGVSVQLDSCYDTHVALRCVGCLYSFLVFSFLHIPLQNISLA